MNINKRRKKSHQIIENVPSSVIDKYFPIERKGR